jgi:hypothetical protein
MAMNFILVTFLPFFAFAAWVAGCAHIVLFYRLIINPINRMRDRKEIEAEIGAQRAIIQNNRNRIRLIHGESGLDRAIELANLELRQQLTPLQFAELKFLRNADLQSQKAAE